MERETAIRNFFNHTTAMNARAQIDPSLSHRHTIQQTAQRVRRAMQTTAPAQGTIQDHIGAYTRSGGLTDTRIGEATAIKAMAHHFGKQENEVWALWLQQAAQRPKF